MLFPKPPSLNRVRQVASEVQEETVEDIHYHRIAVSNLDDIERRLIRHWQKKYGQPQKPLNDYTLEELYIEWLEDYYELHPKEANAVRETMDQKVSPQLQEEWDGKLSDEMEKDRQEYWERRMKKNPNLKVDMDQFKTDEVMTPEKAQAYFDAVGRGGVPKVVDKSAEKQKKPGEFEEKY